HRTLYRGEPTWNKTRKRDSWGRHKQSRRPETEWMSSRQPELQIIPDVLWNRAHERLSAVRRKMETAMPGGEFRRNCRDVESRHLLVGFARCAVCGASFYPVSRSHGKQRAFFYACSANDRRGAAVCPNSFKMRTEAIEGAVLRKIVGDTLKPALVDAVVKGVMDAMSSKSSPNASEKAKAELVKVEREIARYTEAIGAGGNIPSIV